MHWSVAKKVFKVSPENYERLQSLQIAVYVMVGGGLLGRFAAEQPADFYIDARVSRRPYGQRKIKKAVDYLAKIAEDAGLNPRDMPKMLDLPGCTVW